MGFLDRLLGRSAALTPVAAHERAAAGELLLVDVREPGEFRSGHAPGARNVPLAGVGAACAQLAADGRDVAFVCKSGMRSGAAVSAARQHGLHAANVRGGMLAWQRAGLPTTTKGR
ncbi:rhodanese-like domain-containing protein [Paraconexibacter algicola]|uniref:Rhodanese domain-containing protein n=1 Tax=Paraconexibacter algicola TaxID=2133960 RepID=A0A2T4UKG2_9ACTN|nr:rhodanese-like domain-containing protein [Paraconexibacter algicola]PTL59711.1 hypothetical protein C7Y72_08625 [Paraconexibacter algicola]